MLPRTRRVALALVACAAAPAARSTAQSDSAPVPFAIRVVDAETGRGVPLVELRTTHDLLFVTDSAGLAAIPEPALQGRQVFFHVRSHGYEYPKDGFGNRGFRCRVAAGATHRVELRRFNVAERLYRVTGAGIYHDSVLLGAPVPIRAPLLNGGVTGQDSVVNGIYRGRLYWFWGDTNRLAYPLGNFAVSGATSKLPGDGGLPPGDGVDLTYFVDGNGFSRPMCKLEGPGPVWIFGLMVVSHRGGERMLAHFARMKNLGTRYEHGIAEYDDAAERFRKVKVFPLDTQLHPSGNPTRVRDGDGDWFYFPNPYPAVRVPARYEAILDPDRYEAYSCFAPGTSEIEKKDGQVVWGWKRGARPVTPRDVPRLGAAARHCWMGLVDVETGKAILGHGGTVQWNEHRKKWVMIALQTFGRSMLGEVWFAEADTLMGPWGHARRIVTHDRYSFYNVKHHPYFDEDGGRRIYFEGTYTATFSGNDTRTPRYDYNQVMYRLDLDDPRLRLPVPVYEVAGEPRPLPATEVQARNLWPKVEHIPYWIEPGTRGDGLLPVDRERPGTTPVYAWTDDRGQRRLRTGLDSPGSSFRRSPEPVGRAWPAPSRKLAGR